MPSVAIEEVPALAELGHEQNTLPGYALSLIAPVLAVVLCCSHLKRAERSIRFFRKGAARGRPA